MIADLVTLALVFVVLAAVFATAAWSADNHRIWPELGRIIEGAPHDHD